MLIVDNEPIIRTGIKQLVDLKALSIGEVYEVSNGEEAFSIVDKLHPNIVLADINMPGLVAGIREEKARETVQTSVDTLQRMAVTHGERDTDITLDY